MDAGLRLTEYLNIDTDLIGKVIDLDPGCDKLYQFDLTAENPGLDPDIYSDTSKFSEWINGKLADANCRYGIGGYMEHRTIYARSAHFDTGDEPRRLHLGVDIWGKSGTKVYSPLNGIVHSFNDNCNFGDYGPTIILQHQLNEITLYSLYGHLSRSSLNGLYQGKEIRKNELIGAFGTIDENGHWPPHLHFQLMLDMQGYEGDYPGVCRFSEKADYLQNIPDPQLLLRFPAAINRA
ncbi:MAG TPA: peptidoglycan DD-metalloendopeptidase family protein [Mucilaginibacter sp.]|nr:peptidoglycan DD-metalloendopeptidase family protein [Mucilaginibacter sp.]